MMRPTDISRIFRKINIICGHYGTGKTNFALNAAENLAKQGEKVILVDLDIVNPYFRSSDYKNELEAMGIRLIATGSANTTLDAPSLPGEIYSVFEERDSYVFFDVGGDDAGAFALGRYSEKLHENEDYAAFFVINKFRQLIEEPLDALNLMRKIEAASHIKMSALVNNSHLSYNTQMGDISDGYEYAKKVSEITGLPLAATTVPHAFVGELAGKIENAFPIDILVKLPWNTKGG